MTPERSLLDADVSEFLKDEEHSLKYLSTRRCFTSSGFEKNLYVEVLLRPECEARFDIVMSSTLSS
jgi:hypothetical protein